MLNVTELKHNQWFYLTFTNRCVVSQKLTAENLNEIQKGKDLNNLIFWKGCLHSPPTCN